MVKVKYSFYNGCLVYMVKESLLKMGNNEEKKTALFQCFRNQLNTTFLKSDP